MHIHNGHDEEPPHTTPHSRKQMTNNIPSLAIQRLMRPPPMQKLDEFILRLKLSKAEGIDPPSQANPSALKRLYCTVFSGALERRGTEFWSQMVEGCPDPCWNAKWDLKLEANPNCDKNGSTLRMEVLGFSSYGPDGPGTSTGVAMVGGAEVPLPTKLCKQKFHKLQLLRPEGDKFKAEGTIDLSLELMPSNRAESRAKIQFLSYLRY